MTAPIAQTQRCGNYIVAAGSSTVAANGNVSTSLIAADEDWSDVLTKAVVTQAIADADAADTQMPHCIRCPYGAWPGNDGVDCFNHCNTNGTVVRVPVVFHSMIQAAAAPGGVRLTVGFGAFLLGLNQQGCPTTVYFPGLPNYKNPDGSGLTNWASNPLTQGQGYPAITDVKSLAYVRALLADGLDNGMTEAAFDGCGGDRSTYMLSNILFPMLAAAGTHTAALQGFTGSLTNSHARVVSVEANPQADTGAWLEDYTFTARYPTFTNRIGDTDYIQPDDVASTPSCIIQQTTRAGYDVALSLLQAGYRVWVKWSSMRATVGQTDMLALLDAGLDPTPTTTTTGDGWMKRAIGQRGWRARSAGIGDARW